jgi:microcystin-dependent protein
VSDPFVGEIRAVGFNFAPKGWALCNGQLLAISQNTALFSLLGTFYGGNGTTNFALPNLQGATPISFGQGSGLSNRVQGQSGGETAVTLLASEMPIHTHAVSATSGAGNQIAPGGNVWAQAGRTTRLYTAAGGGGATAMSPQATSVAGGSVPHNNMPPFLVVNFVIALQGIFPPRS